MNYVKRTYLKIESFLSNKPIATATIFAIVTPLLTAIVSVQDFKTLMTLEYNIKGYIIFGVTAFQLFTLTLSIFYIKQRSAKRKFIMRINSLVSKLNNPFERESETVYGKQVIKERFFDYEMIKSFKEYNGILTEIKAKWTKEFQDLEPLINDKRIHPGDWIPESELNGVKVSLLQLRERLKID